MSLATYPNLDWRGRQAVLVAEAEHEALRLYEMDLIWMLVKAKYDGEFPQPSKFVKRGYKKKEPQSAGEIRQYVLDKFTV